MLYSPQLPLRNRPRLRLYQVPKAIRRIIAADTILIRIYLENILRPIRIVLQRRQTLDQSSAPLVNKETSGHSIARTSEMGLGLW